VVVRPQETSESTGKALQRKAGKASSRRVGRGRRPEAAGSAGGKQGQSARPPTETKRKLRQPRHAALQPPQVGGPTTPVFSWVAVRGVTYYDFELFRGAKRVFTARPRQPRLTLPLNVDLRGRHFSRPPGSYRWLVRAGLSREYEDAIWARHCQRKNSCCTADGRPPPPTRPRPKATSSR